MFLWSRKNLLLFKSLWFINSTWLLPSQLSLFYRILYFEAPEGLEPPAFALEGPYSIQLNYGALLFAVRKGIEPLEPFGSTPFQGAALPLCHLTLHTHKFDYSGTSGDFILVKHCINKILQSID